MASSSSSATGRRAIPVAQRRDLQAKIPDIEKCLDVVATLKAKKGTGEAQAVIAHFEVFEGISQAWIEEADSMCLRLGANVMLECPLEEANAMLKKNLKNGKVGLDVLVADLLFWGDRVTIV